MSDKSERTVLVTGGAGYLGSHACKTLSRAGYLPVTYDNLSAGHEWAVKWGPLERGDILDPSKLSAVIARYRPSAVMHFAALAYVGESVVEPTKYYRTNVVGTLTLLDAMRAHNVDRIVFSSTCATYGTPDVVPISEDAPQRPINPYGASKLMIERILADYDAAYRLKSMALRYFNAAGADPEGEIGEAHDPETHLIPLALDAAAGLRPAIAIFGNDYDTPDGTCIRDYIHVSDLAEAHVLALKRLLTGHESASVNLGAGRGASVKEVIAAAETASGSSIQTEANEKRVGDPACLIADPRHAQHLLGWRANRSDLATIIGDAWRWHTTGLRPQGKARRQAIPTDTAVGSI